MSRYTPSVSAEFDCEGDTVKIKFNRLTRNQFGKLSAFMMGAETNEEGASMMQPDRAMAMLDACAEFLPDVITHFEGLTNADGEPLGKEVIFTESYFTPLLSEIVGTIAEASIVNEKKP
jgi:hypothetical protein